jgi:Flp pilus assembly protein TadD
MAHFRQALELRPAFASAHNNLGVVLLRQGRRAEAIAHFQQALAIRPGYPEAQRNLEAALGARGK